MSAVLDVLERCWWWTKVAFGADALTRWHNQRRAREYGDLAARCHSAGLGDSAALLDAAAARRRG